MPLTVAHPLRRAVLAAGLRLDGFALRVGVSPSHLSHILAARKAAPDGFYERCAAVLGVDADEIRPEAAAAA